jgi:deazaflavin-dependent oxidoreductase (nitroreductase family)
MNPLQRLARNPTAYRLLMPAGGPLIEGAEALLRFLSVGRVGVLDAAGLPGVRITASGRKTGLARTATVLCTPVDDGLVVIGSNWGRRHHPAWSANLKSAQQVSVRRRGRVCTARVRLLTGDERERAWVAALERCPNYRIAEDRSGGREFRVFLLTPAA